MNLTIFILLNHILHSPLIILLIITEYHFFLKIDFTLLSLDCHFVLIKYFCYFIITEWWSSSFKIFSILNIMNRLVLFRSLNFLIKQNLLLSYFILVCNILLLSNSFLLFILLHFIMFGSDNIKLLFPKIISFHIIFEFLLKSECRETNERNLRLIFLELFKIDYIRSRNLHIFNSIQKIRREDLLIEFFSW